MHGKRMIDDDFTAKIPLKKSQKENLVVFERKQTEQ